MGLHVDDGGGCGGGAGAERDAETDEAERRRRAGEVGRDLQTNLIASPQNGITFLA